MNIGLWFITHSTVLLMLLTGFYQRIYVYNNYSCYIHHVEIQLNDVIKVSLVLGIVALPIQTNAAKNSSDASIGIGESLLIDHMITLLYTMEMMAVRRFMPIIKQRRK